MTLEWKYYPVTEKRLAAHLLYRDGVHSGWSVLDTRGSCDGKWSLLFFTFDESGAPKTVEWKQFWNSLEDAKRRAEQSLKDS